MLHRSNGNDDLPSHDSPSLLMFLMHVFSKHSRTQQPHMIQESYLDFNNCAASLAVMSSSLEPPRLSRLLRTEPNDLTAKGGVVLKPMMVLPIVFGE